MKMLKISTCAYRGMHVRVVEKRQAVVGIAFKRLHLVATANLSMVIMYSYCEYCDICFIFGQCNDNASRTAREYSLRYPSCRHRDAKVILRLDSRLRNTGSVDSTHNLYDVDGRTHGGLNANTGRCNTSAEERKCRVEYMHTSQGAECE